MVNPQLHFERLTAMVEHLSAIRSVLRQLIQLSYDAPEITDMELHTRLVALAYRARLVQPT